MTKTKQWQHSMRKLPLAMAVAASMSTPVSAFQFYLGDVEANLDTTLSAGASWRMEEQSDLLIGNGNGGVGGSINSDDGVLNFEKNDTYSKIVKGTTDFLINAGDFGAFVRARYWYDFELKDEQRAVDSVGKQRTLSPDGLDNASGGEFLDAYVFADFWLGDEIPVSVRLGKQVVSWGESTFIFNGINVINPVDINAIRAPGAEIKDALLPVNMFYASAGVTEDITLEGFVQLEYEPSRISDCGTFFSTIDYVADGCGPVYGSGTRSENNNVAVTGDPIAVPRLGDREPDDTDQFGVAMRWFLPELNETELGLYFIQYHSRFPTVGGFPAQDANGDGSITIEDNEAFDPVTGAKYFIEYPEQIKLYGISFNTNAAGISFSGEYSYKQDVPFQLNSFDLIFGAIGNIYSPVFQDRVPDTNGDGIATVPEAEASGFLSNAQPGFDLYDVSQLQFTGISFIDQVLGASRLALVGEIGGTYVHGLPPKDEIRYGRFDQVGVGILPDIQGPGSGAAVCAQATSSVPANCDSKGFTSDFSWGYRARAALTYNDVFAGVNLTPTLAWSHDVEGYAPGPGANFVQGRQSAGLSLRADYLNQYSANISYTSFFGNKKHNALHDRDNLSLSVAYSF